MKVKKRCHITVALLLARILVSTHVEHNAKGFAGVEQLKCLVDLFKRKAVSDILLAFELALSNALREHRDILAALPTTKGSATPHTANDKVEGTGFDLNTRGSHSNDDAFSPATVRAL